MLSTVRMVSCLSDRLRRALMLGTTVDARITRSWLSPFYVALSSCALHLARGWVLALPRHALVMHGAQHLNVASARNAARGIALSGRDTRCLVDEYLLPASAASRSRAIVAVGARLWSLSSRLDCYALVLCIILRERLEAVLGVSC